MRRAQGDDGVLGGLDGLLVGVVVFVFGGLFLASVWAAVDAKLAATAAARAGVRAYVEAPDGGAGRTAAGQAVAATLADRHVRLDGWELVAGPFRRCARATVVVRAAVPVLSVPLLGGLGLRSVTARHSSVVDPYRSAATLTDEARCG